MDMTNQMRESPIQIQKIIVLLHQGILLDDS